MLWPLFTVGGVSPALFDFSNTSRMMHVLRRWCRLDRYGQRMMFVAIAAAVLIAGGVSMALAQDANTFRSYRLQHRKAGDLRLSLMQLLATWQNNCEVLVDEPGNRLLVSGPAQAQQVAQQFVHDADAPPPTPAATPIPAGEKASPPRLSTYRVPLHEFTQRLRQVRQIAGSRNAQVAGDNVAGRIYVLANDSVHEEVALLLGQSLTPKHQPNHASRDGSVPQAVGANAAIPVVHRSWRLVSSPQHLVSQLQSLLTSRLETIATQNDRVVMRCTAGDGQADLVFSTHQRSAAAHGPEPLVAELLRLIAVMDQPVSPGRSMRFLQVTGLRHESTDEYYAQTGRPAEPTADGAVRQVNFLQPAPNQPTSDGQDANANPLSSIQRRARFLRQLGLDVEVEVLPGLDIIILRGQDEDVKRMEAIIREIENVSQIADPQIEVIRLAHVRSTAAVQLLNDALDALTDGQQGDVAAFDLAAPNALLLVGWGEAIQAAKELVAKIDLPVDPATQVRVFRLEHMPAARAAAMVEQFWSDRPGLGSQPQVAAEPRTNSLIVHAAPREMGEVELLLARIDVPAGAAVSRVRLFPLQHTLAADLAETLQAAIDAASGTAESDRASILELLTIDADREQLVRSGLLDQVEITANTQTNTLVVTADEASMDLIAALIEQLDVPVATAQIKVFRVTNGDANSLVLMLRSLLPSQSGGTLPPRLAGAVDETSLAPLRFSVEQRTNSIIAAGSAGDLKIIEALLLRLDENDAQRRRTAVYRLKNAPAVDVALAINNFLRGERQLQLLVPGDESPLEQLEREVVVVPEPVSNTLILSATPRFYDEIEQLIERLDAQPPQVLIQVLIAEVGLNDVDEFGVELGLQDSVLFDRSMLGDLITTTNTDSASTPSGVVTSTNEIIRSATNVPGFLFNNTGPLGNSGSTQAFNSAEDVGTQGIVNFSVGRLNNQLGFGGLVLSASSESVSVLVRALQEDRRLEVLSRPQVMTLDNQPAFVQVGQRVPRVVATQLTNFGQVNSVELDNVGLILGVTPRISRSGMVVMEVDVEKSQVGPVEDGIPISIANNGDEIRSPRIDITTAQTTVSAASGETIVLGGLITRRQRDQSRRVPLLADIPLIGDLFRYDLSEYMRTELLIILTPRVVFGPAEAERLKQVEAARMSWCAADVHALHGDGGFCGRSECPVCQADVPVIYPDDNPRGDLPNAEPAMPLPDNTMTVPPQPTTSRLPPLGPAIE